MDSTKLRAAIADMADDIAARSAEIEEARRLPADLAETLSKAGLFNILKPAELSGPELSPDAVMRLIADISQINASVGWCVMIGATSTLAAAYLDDDAARAIYGQPDDIHGGVFAPMGKATFRTSSATMSQSTNS